MNRSPMLKIILLSVIMLVTACGRVTEVPEPPAGPEPSYAVQPEIPMYEQLLLKGDVKSVTDYRIALNHHEHNGIERYEFDTDRQLTYYFHAGMEWGCDKDTECSLFPLIKDAYAFWLFPDTWQETDRGSIEGTVEVYDDNGDVIATHDKRIEYEWNDDGFFTKMRCFLDDEPVPLQETDIYALENYLYDENGYPSRMFAFDLDQPRNIYYLDFSNPDEQGNPQTIYLHFGNNVENTKTILYRNIEYYDNDE